ncbi:MAG: WG repeat-containing protein [Bacillota bacterium]|nr:WG repeat-containing protein [Bacillota bacterium]
MKKIPMFIIMTLIFSFITASAQGPRELKAYTTDTKVTVNGAEHKFSNETVNIDGSTYVPLRELAETLGYKVTWDAEKREAVLEKDEGCLFKFEQNGLWGFMDRGGNVIISPQYNDAEDFSEGLAVVEKGDKYGYINEKGETVIPFQYDEARSFHCGLAGIVKPGDTFHGEPPIYTVNYIDQKGMSAGTVECMSLSDFTEDGFAAIKPFSGGFFVDKSIKQVSPTYRYVGEFAEGLAPAADESGKFGVVDTNFKTVVDFKFDYIRPYSNGLAVFGIGNDYGFIDRNGNVVIEAKYGYCGCEDYSDGLIPVSLDNGWGCLNSHGDLVFSGDFEYIDKYHDGLSMVIDKKTENYGFIDCSGKYVVEPKYNYALPYNNGLMYVYDDENPDGYYIDRAGNRVGPKN